jgi:hypothetical protein
MGAGGPVSRSAAPDAGRRSGIFSRVKRLLAGCLVLSIAAAGWLYVENRRLAGALQTARASAPAPVGAEAAVPVERLAPSAPAARRPAAEALAALGTVARALGKAPERPGPRRFNLVREMLGRRAGESDEAYRGRVAPEIAGVLQMPRDRVEDKRREFEAAAEVSDAQRGEIDRALDDAKAELLAVANQAVASGELTPYRRNTAGLLSFAASAAPIAEQFDARVGKILSPEQLAILQQTGFDWIQYGALTTKWESLRPPPPQ